ncbi:MAG: M20/M25/M40 family metallo-hydrolase [Acutalibacteraceae bacterium]|jgi:putative aminopeptidase FrvX
MDLRDVLRRLCLAPGVGGQTAVTDEAKALLSRYTKEITVSPMGNVTGIIRCGRDDAPLVMLEAHLDQIGMVVTAIEEGFVRVAACGGLDLRTLTASEVVVYGDKPYPGVFASTPPHLMGEDKKFPTLEERMIDIGLTQEQAEKAAPLGSRVGFLPRLEPLGETAVAGTSLDDRAGMAAVLFAVDALQGESLDADIAVCFAVQEELGTRAAGSGTFALMPDAAIAVDVSFAYTPDANKKDCGELGKGPMIGLAPGLDDGMTRRLIALAEEENIPYQREVMGEHTGTDADEIGVTGAGVPTALLSIPQKYMHTPVEVVDVRDVENVGRLMAAFVKGGIGR